MYTAQRNAHGNIIVCKGDRVRNSYTIIYTGSYDDCNMVKSGMITRGETNMDIRQHCKFGTFTVHAHDGQIWAEVNGALYFWNPNAGSGFPGAVQHGGNFLHGTEFRRPASGGGDWVQYPHLEHGHVVTTRGLGHGSNFYPNMEQVERALRGEASRWSTWERTNPVPGHNDEWIALTADNAAALPYPG